MLIIMLVRLTTVCHVSYREREFYISMIGSQSKIVQAVHNMYAIIELWFSFSLCQNV